MTPTPRILVAGVGNIFRGDDAFGCEVVRRLARQTFPTEVRLADFGTRGHDLAYALLAGYDAAILVDTIARGSEPGTLHVLELDAGKPQRRTLNSHDVDLPAVFDLVSLMGGTLPRLYLIGCEPAELGNSDEGAMGLSEPVAAAVPEAIRCVQELVARLLTQGDILFERSAHHTG